MAAELVFLLGVVAGIALAFIVGCLAIVCSLGPVDEHGSRRPVPHPASAYWGHQPKPDGTTPKPPRGLMKEPNTGVFLLPHD